MYDKELIKSILSQISDALAVIKERASNISSAAMFTDTPQGKEKLDGICMLFVAVGESLKNIDKITKSNLLSNYPEIDWTGVKGFRDIVAHHYFNIDAEMVFWICTKEISLLQETINKMIIDIEKE